MNWIEKVEARLTEFRDTDENEPIYWLNAVVSLCLDLRYGIEQIKKLERLKNAISEEINARKQGSCYCDCESGSCPCGVCIDLRAKTAQALLECEENKT